MGKKVSELEGAELDYWVAKAEGHDAEVWGQDCMVRTPFTVETLQFNPSHNWSYGGPIIERERINLEYPREGFWVSSIWIKHENREKTGYKTFVIQQGATALIAAMRAYVASKFREEVSDE